MEIGKYRSKEEIIKDIKSVLESKVKDNVATHGGMINFLSYDKGIVKLEMAGACSGCAMSKKTLHEGVERMLKHYIPEVNQLIGEDDEQAAEKGYTPWATL
jgi:Fe-S cluster biogenesis protein NfuA